MRYQPPVLAPQHAIAPMGIAKMIALEKLPLFNDGVQVHYEGSIDKAGGNADWDWWLYQDEAGEWVILDVDGPGCIYNFVQHRYPTSPEPVFRFYFDGESRARFEITASEIGAGTKYPFVAPLAAVYEGPATWWGHIWVLRSFVPMPFARSVKVTSSLRLQGPRQEHGEGGWGHFVYHTYTATEGVTTFTGAEDYSRLLDVWRRVGEDPKDITGYEETVGQVQIPPTGRASSGVPILQREGQGAIAALKLRIHDFELQHLTTLWLKTHWDGHTRPDVNLPIGAFFANSLGYHDVRLLLHGMTTDGTFYCYFPMPYWESAEIEILNRAYAPVELEYEIQVLPSAVLAYPRGQAGYFRATYCPPTSTVQGRDSIIGEFSGHGHVVAGHVTSHGYPGRGSCEGDVRVHIDGIATPQVESDGSESWVCYGWGFPTPPQVNPSSAYDGVPNEPWSMTRLMTGDLYPFQTGLRFGIEHGGHNDQHHVQSGALFYYGEDTPHMRLTDVLDIGLAESEQAHDYVICGQTDHSLLVACYEGDDDDVFVSDRGRAHSGYSEFSVTVDPRNTGVRLRRRSDQQQGRQRAKVYVDGVHVVERGWYYADRNPIKRWLEDEFEIPGSYTRGRARIAIRLENAGPVPWTEYRYWVYSYGILPEEVNQ